MKNIDKFLAWEKKNKLFDDKHKKNYFWILIRSHIYNEILLKKNNIDNPHPFNKINIISKIKNVIIKLFRCITKNPFFYNKKADIVIFNHSRRVKKGNIYECIYTDKWLKELNDNYIVLENEYNGMHYAPVDTSNLYYLDLINVKRAINKIIKRRVDTNILDKRYVDYYINNLEKEFDLKLDRDKIYNKAKKALIDFIYLKKQYMKLLKKISPKAIIEVVHYDIHKYAANVAAKELGIKIIEIQHGIISSDHLAYNYYSKNLKLDYFPDYIFTFGEIYNNIARYPMSSDRIISTGFVNLNPKNYRSINNNKIIFLSQGTIGKKLSKLAIELSEILECNYEIIYKLHPSEYGNWRSLYPQLIGISKIEVIDYNVDLYEVFEKCFAQVGVYSTALVEGVAFNLDTYILDTSLKENLSFLYEANQAKLISTACDIKNYIENNECNNLNTNRSMLWKEDANKNIVNEIKKIIDK